MAANINIPEGFEIENEFHSLPKGFELEHGPKTDKGYNGAVIENYNPKNKIYDPYNLLNKFKECLEWVQRTPFSAYQEGKNQVEIADLEMKSIYPWANQSVNDKKRLDYLSSQAPKNYNIYEPKYKQKDPSTIIGALERTPYYLKKSYVNTARMTPMLLETIKAGGIGSAAGAILGAGGSFALGQAGPNAFVPDELLTMPTMALAGARWGGGLNAARRTFELEAGLAKNELRQINNEIISKGGKPLSDDEMNLLSIGVGGVNAGLEMVSLKPVLKTLPGGKEILAQFEKKQLKEFAASKTVRAKLAGVLKDYGNALVWESGTEIAQEAVNIIAGEHARKLGGIEATPLKENVARVLEIGADTFGAMIFLGGVGSVAQTAKILAMQGISEKAAKAKAENMTSEERHNFIDDNFGSLVASIKDLPEVKELEKQEKYSEAKRLVSDDISAQMIEAGRDEQEAQRLGELASVIYDKIAQGDSEGKTAYDIYNKYNVTIRGGVQMDVAPKEKAEAEIFNQPLDPSVDLNQKVNILDLSDKIQSGKKETPLSLKNYLHSLIGTKPLTTADNKAIVNFIRYSRRKGKTNVYVPSHIANSSKKENSTLKPLRNTAIKNVTNLIQNSVFIEKIKNTKKDTKPDIDYYYRFYVPVKFNNKIHTVRLVAENNIKNNSFNIANTNLYDVIFETDKKPISSMHTPKKGSNGNLSTNNIITDNQTSFNPETITIKEMLKGIKDAQGDTYFQTAYHGTPYKFDKFTLNKIGSGEGAQAHGWGLYFAESKQSSWGYRHSLSRRKNLQEPTIKNIPISQVYQQLDIQAAKEKSHKKSQTYYDKMALLEELMLDKSPEEIINNYSEPEYNYAEALEWFKNDVVPYMKYSGSLFKVDIPETDVLLDENKTFNAQSKKVKAALRKLFKDNGKNLTDLMKSGYANGNPKGASLYSEVMSMFTQGSNKKASLLLNQYGIKGITYDNAEDGRCYVVFDDKAIEVLETYYQSQNTDNVRGSINFLKDDEGNIRQSVIDLVSGKADKSTMLHEFSHLFLQTLILESENNLKARDMLLSVNKWLKSNGKEYTRAQHEKFAQGFEAYVMSGKAPTSKLKQAFEKFAQWLRDIYTALDGSTKIKLTPEAKEVFDNLIADEDFEDQKKKSKDILEKAKYFAQARYEPTEEQLRHKQVAYNILSSATNRNKKWLQMVLESSSNTHAMQKKKERIYNELDKVDDKITLNGFDPSWLEFFSNKGVNYYDDEVGADYNLAFEAYNVIVNRTWLKTNEEYYEFQEAQLQYQYILKEYEKAKRTEDRTTVLLAYYDWLETVPKIVQQDYGNKWMHDTNEIERFEHLNKFEQAKEIIFKRADMLRNQSGVEEYKNVVNTLLNSLDFLSYSDRNKILNKITLVKNVDELKNNIDEIMDFAQCLEDMSTRRDISERIQDELRSTKNIRTNGRTRGKYDYSTNKLFEKLRDINRLNVEQADTLYAQLQEDLSAMSEDEREAMSFEDKLIRKFATYKAYGQRYISSDFLSDLYADIVFSKMQGRLAKDEADFNKRIENDRAIDNVLNRLEKKRTAKGVTKLYTKFANLESFLNLFLDKNFVNEYSVLYEETQVQTKSYLEKQEILKNISNILNVKPFFIDDKIFEKLNEKYTFKDYSLKRPKDIELNKMQLIGAYIYSKNPLIMDRLINMFGHGGFDRIMSLLTPEDRQIGDILQRAAGKYYNPINQIYIKKYGIDMPKAKNYYPVHADIVRELDMFNQYSEQSISPSFTKSRSDSAKIPIKLTNPIQTLFSHIEKANSLILLEEKLSKLNKVFKDRTVAAFIEEKYGEDAYKEFLNQITDSSYTKRSERLSAMDNINKMVNNIIGATITLKPKISATQLVSVINFADKMPVASWFSGFLKALATPRKTIEFMMSNDYLKQRFGEGAQNEALVRIVKASNFAKSKKFIDFFSLNVKLGDIGAIIFGGKPYVDYLMDEKGLSPEEAFKEFVLEVNRAQQAATTSSLSAFQRSNNPIFRLYYAYQNTTNQYFRKAADAIISHANGDISKKEMAKTILIYTVFNNFLYRMVANPYVWILGLSAGEWDEFAKEAILSVFDINSSAIMFFGNIYQAILNALLERPVLNPDRALEKIPKDINEILLEGLKDGIENIELDTWLNAIGDILDTSTGIPASTLINMGSAAGDFAQGEVGLGVMKLGGYSDYQAKKAFNIKD